MRDPLDSNWSVDAILPELAGYRRVDDGGDLLAFRMAGPASNRFLFVYLYGSDPDYIHYDLEDPSVDNYEWDHAIERGSVRTVADLRSICERWFGKPD